MDVRHTDEDLTPAAPEETTSGGRLLLGWILIVAGAVMLFIGWYGVSGQPLVAAQIAWLVSGGLGGLMCGVVGVGLLISNDVRRDRERLGRVEAAVLEIQEMLNAQAGALHDSEPQTPVNGHGQQGGRVAKARSGRLAASDKQ